MKVRPLFRWFDLWIGVYVDVPGRRVFVFPIPCFGVELGTGDWPAPLRWLRERLARVRRERIIRAALGFPWLPSLSDFELVIVTRSRWGSKAGEQETTTSEARSYRIDWRRAPLPNFREAAPVQGGDQ